ncbi:hypothetical protein E3N88_04400 [Mikania micrantha]|uniref:STICHEL DnaA-N-like alpha-beta domain-containing protein n=1 Tax=Mikania micrantha TaxID=192012 RepID=A0A5N6PUW4_9ASTR|nr:hypothetical protein E3N88_04400 [Mikania micrantha]
MAGVVCDRILKDANGNVSDHQHNHIHLTNCIHLKNHMHKNSPMMTERSLMRDLLVLQRSRAVREPSMSPPLFQSSPALDPLLEQAEKDGDARGDGGRRSIGLSANSLLNVGTGDGIYRRKKKEESSRKGFKDDPRIDVGDTYPRSSDDKHKQNRQKSKQDDHVKTLSQQVNNVPNDIDNVASSHNCIHGGMELKSSLHSHGLKRVKKRRKFRSGMRVSRASKTNTSMASNFASQVEYAGQCHITRGLEDSCGILFNWSDMHDHRKSFLDAAGRSLSCGLSDSRSKRAGQQDSGQLPVMSYHSTSSTNSESLPLLMNSSQESREDPAAWVHDYSGKLNLYAENLFNSEMDSDLSSEARLGHQKRSRDNTRHQNLTQKYTPRTFQDLVGQNLAVQALSNAIVRNKIGLLYVFYGPHGTGKTSCARIFARALTCQSLDHPKPCGYCNSCVAHDTGKNQNIQEVGPMNNLGYKSTMKVFKNMIVSHKPSHYRVVIINDCDTLDSNCWSAISKVVDRAPRHMVFVFVNSSLDVLPHTIISRCQKFFFPKLKDADIIDTLQWIATKEDFEIDKDALKLIALRSNVSKEDMEKLRLALKTLSKAEKQLRMSNDKLTWLTATLLQLAPNQQYVLPTSSVDARIHHSPLGLNNGGIRGGSRKSNFRHGETRGLLKMDGNSSGIHKKMKNGLNQQEIEETWLEVLENIQINSIKEFLHHEGKLTLLSFGAAPVVQLTFTSHVALLKAEKFKTHVLKAFKHVFGSPVTIEIRSEIRKEKGDSQQDPYEKRSEIVEAEVSPIEPKAKLHNDKIEAAPSQKNSSAVLERRLCEQGQSMSIVKGKVSLGSIIQQAETQRNRWSTHKAVSIVQKLEQEKNLRTERRSRSLLCWKASRVARRKLTKETLSMQASRLKLSPRRPRALLRFMSCGRFLATRSVR